MSYFFRSFPSQIMQTSRSFVKVLRNTNLNRDSQFKYDVIGNTISRVSNVRFLTNTPETSPKPQSEPMKDSVQKTQDDKKSDGNSSDNLAASKEKRDGELESSKFSEVKLESPKSPEVKLENPKSPEVKLENPKSPEVKLESPKPLEVKLESPKSLEVKLESSKPLEIKLENSEQKRSFSHEWVAATGTFLGGLSGVAALFTAIAGITMAYNNRDALKESLGIRDTGLISLKLLKDRSDEENIKFLNEAKHEFISFSRTAQYGFAEYKDGGINPIRQQFELLLKRNVKFGVVLPGKSLIPELQNQPGLKNINVEASVIRTLLDIKKLNDENPNNQITVKLTDKILFVTGDLIDYDHENAKVAYTRCIEKSESPLLYTFSKNRGKGLGYAETADKMIAIWNALPRYDLNSNTEYDLTRSPDTMVQNANNINSIWHKTLVTNVVHTGIAVAGGAVIGTAVTFMFKK